MQRFTCSCGQSVFFESRYCVRCGRILGFSPERQQVVSLEPAADGFYLLADSADFGERFSLCANRDLSAACNWVSPGEDGAAYCRGCRLNRLIPALDVEGNPARWNVLENAKRRLLRALIRFNLEFESPGPYATPALAFAFKEDRRTNSAAGEDYVHTGHLDGLITINIAEADAGYREQVRIALGQPYRTVLGHLRHESGHFFFDRLLRCSPQVERFREIFGDERADYAGAIERFYARPARPPSPDFVSDYASAHPLEDWAECWAHVLHIEDTLETAQAHGIAPASTGWFERWEGVSVMLNELNRSMGLPDAYPFVITPAVAGKLRFTRDLVQQAGHAIGSAAGR